MIVWIRRIAKLLSMVSFILILFSGLDLSDPFNGHLLSLALMKAFAGAVICWLIGFVMLDIVFKGIVEDIALENINQLEGGIVQRIHSAKKQPQVLDSKEKPEIAMEDKNKPTKKK